MCIRDRDKSVLAGANLEMMDGVDKCVPIMHSYKLASRDICPEGRTVSVGGVVIGGKKLAMMAGPCAVDRRAGVHFCGIRQDVYKRQCLAHGVGPSGPQSCGVV